MKEDNIICIENNKTLEFPELKFTVPETLNVVDDKIILLNLVDELPYHNLSDSFGYDIMTDVYNEHPDIKDYILKSMNDLSEDYDYVVLASDDKNRLIFSDTVENKIRKYITRKPDINQLCVYVFEEDKFIYDELKKLGVECYIDDKIFMEMYSDMLRTFGSMCTDIEDVGTFEISKITSNILLKSILHSFDKHRNQYFNNYEAYNTFNRKRLLIYDECTSYRNDIIYYKNKLKNICNPECIHIASLFDLYTDNERCKRVVYPETNRKRRKQKQ